jgi:hypothetical protein
LGRLCAAAAAAEIGRQSKISPIPPVAPESIAAASSPLVPSGDEPVLDFAGAIARGACRCR